MASNWLASTFFNWLVSCNGLWVHDWWEFSPFFKGHWQSPCTALPAGIWLPLVLCKGAVKQSEYQQPDTHWYHWHATQVCTLWYVVRWTSMPLTSMLQVASLRIHKIRPVIIYTCSRHFHLTSTVWCMGNTQLIWLHLIFFFLNN